jgi:hypothetical protein
MLGRLLANMLLGLAVLFVAWMASLLLMVGHENTPSKSPVPFLVLWGACGFPTIVAWTGFIGMVWAKTRSRSTTYAAGLMLMLGWAFWMLMQAMGRTEMFSGLHAFVQKYRGNPDHPALHDLFEVLRPHAKDPAASRRLHRAVVRGGHATSLRDRLGRPRARRSALASARSRAQRRNRTSGTRRRGARR